jgi:uncharacterized protein (TIGR01777 family)
MKVLVTGASGLVGSALLPALASAGHQAVRLSRVGGGAGSPAWDPETGRVDGSLEGFDAVVHLAGESIASGRWNAGRKRRIRDSRVKGTRLLSEALAALSRPPRALIAASAIGFYGDRGDEALTESSAPGEGFLPSVCQEWEAACAPAAAKGIRVVNLRFGMILSPRGGALAKMLTPFKLGVGGPIGPGSQFMSWITLDDAAGIVLHALGRESLRGPVNAVAPVPSTNAGFTKALGRTLRRPAFLPMPAFAARLAFGEMADALLLSSARVLPRALEKSAYPFKHPALEEALRDILR